MGLATEGDEIYIRKNSQKFGSPANIKDPGIFPSRLYTVQFESIILLNIQGNFFLSTLPTSVTLQRGFPKKCDDNTDFVRPKNNDYEGGCKILERNSVVYGVVSAEKNFTVGIMEKEQGGGGWGYG